LFDDDVDQALGDRVVSVLKLIVQLNNSLSRLANQDGVLSTSEVGVKSHIFFNLVKKVDLLA
jgi:hypothetical protein